MNILRFMKRANIFWIVSVCLTALNFGQVSASQPSFFNSPGQGTIPAIPRTLFEGCTPISFDAAASGSILTIGATECYTFDGMSGDRILIRLLDNDDTMFYPEFTIYKPDETSLCAGFGDPFTENICTLDMTGIQSLLINDHGNDQTGTYSIYVQRLNVPINALQMNFDQEVSGNIFSGLDINAYTFSGTSGKSVLIRMLDSSGTAFYPSFDLYDATGTLVCWNGGDPLTENECPLTGTGPYSIFVSDFYNTQAGSYNLYVQELTNPGDMTPINFDDVTSGFTTSGLDVNAHTFNASAGDRVLIHMLDTTGTDFYPKFSVYRSDGSLLYSCIADGDFLRKMSVP